MKVWAVGSDHTQQDTFFDYPELPAELVSRWTAVDSDRLVLTDLALFFLRSCALLAVVGTIASGMAGGSHLWTSAGWALGFLVLFGAGQLIHTRRHHRPGGITPAEIDRVLLHRVEIRPEAWELHPRPLEAMIADRAVLASARIDECLGRIGQRISTQHVHLDPTEESRQIKVAAWRIFQFRRELRSDSGRPVELDEESRSVRASVTDSLLSATATLNDRTLALERYADSLDAVTAENDRQVRSEELTQLGDRIAFDLIPLNVAQEMAAERITGLRDHLDTLLLTNRLETDR